MSFPRYPKYKASGVVWLGDVPQHWEVTKLRHVVSRIEQGWSPQCESEPISSSHQWGVLKVGCVNGGVFDPAENKALPADLAAPPELGIRRGDVLISRANTRELVGSVAVPDSDHPRLLLCDKLYRLRVNERATSAFVQRLLQATPSRSRIELAASGASASMVNISQEVVLQMECAIPSSSEQATITAFLDRETAKIDALVAEQQRLIELLKEKRQAVISHAVTKGLNPNAKMKSSGIEWLGDVPAHWNLHRIGHLFHEASDPGADDLPVLSVSIHDGVSDDELGEDDLERKVTRSEDRTKYKRVRPRDLVYNMMRAWQGGFGTVAVDGMVSPAYVVARPRDGVPTWLVEQQLRTPTAIQEMRRHSRGVTDFRLRLYWEEFKTMVVTLPPDREVAAIEGFMHREEGAAASLVAEAERAITLLQERRTALISAAVTGQIDVRNVREAARDS